MSHQIGDAPIEERHRELLRSLAASIDASLNGSATGQDRAIGFVLLVFPYGGRDGRANYISNGANRRDIVTLFKEQIARFEGQPELRGHG